MRGLGVRHGQDCQPPACADDKTHGTHGQLKTRLSVEMGLEPIKMLGAWPKGEELYIIDYNNLKGSADVNDRHTCTLSTQYL